MYLLALAISAGGAAFAQNAANEGDKDGHFEPPINTIERRFEVDLGKGNKMRIELSNTDELSYFYNIDSLLRVFLQDMEPFKDSLSDELLIKTIDYRTEPSGRKLIRIRRNRPKGDSYVIDNGGLAALKLDQDTIRISSFDKTAPAAGAMHHVALYRFRRVTFMLNRVNDLKELAQTSLNGKIALMANRSTRWHKEHSEWQMDDDKSISSLLPRGHINYGYMDALNPIINLNMQNYKSYFAPSFSLGLLADFNNEINLVKSSRKKYVVGLAWEPQFVFQDVQGKLQTYRNDFLNVSFGFGFKSRDPKNQNLDVISLGYLVRRQGDYFDKNTFRLSVERLYIFRRRVQIEPGIYFNNLFRGVTPTLRISI